VAREEESVPQSPLDRLSFEKLTDEQRVGWSAKGGLWPDKHLVQVLGSARGRAWGGVNVLAVSADGKRLAGASASPPLVIVWDAETLAPVAALRTPGVVSGLGFTEKDSCLLIGTADGKASPTLRWRIGGTYEVLRNVSGQRFSPDGKRFLRSFGMASVLGDVQRGTTIKRITDRKDVVRGDLPLGAAFAPDGTAFLPGTTPGQVVQLDSDGKILETFPFGSKAWPSVIVALADGKGCVAYTTPPGLWLLRSGEAPVDLGVTRACSAVAVSPSGKCIAWAGPGHGSHVGHRDQGWRDERAPPQFVYALAYLPDGRLVSGDSSGNLRLWDEEFKRELVPQTMPPASFTSLAFSPSGEQIVVTGGGGWRCVHDVATNSQRFLKVKPQFLETSWACFSPNGKAILVSDTDGGLDLVDAGDGTTRKRFPKQVWGNQVAFSPDGERIFAANGWQTHKSPQPDRENVVRAYDLKGTELFCCVGHTARVYRLALSDNDLLLTGSAPAGGAIDEFPIRLWDAHTGEAKGGIKLPKEYNLRGLAISRDGRSAAACSHAGTLDCIDLTPGSEKLAWSEKIGGMGCGVVMAPDGRIVVALADGRVQIWDRKKRDKWMHEAVLPGPISALALAPDGRHVATANANGTVYVIRLPGASR
jgi:WD40 repeat protein